MCYSGLEQAEELLTFSKYDLIVQFFPFCLQASVVALARRGLWPFTFLLLFKSTLRRRGCLCLKRLLEGSLNCDLVVSHPPFADWVPPKGNLPLFDIQIKIVDLILN